MTMTTDGTAGGRWAASATTKAASCAAVDHPKAAVTAAGSAIRKAILRRPGVGGTIRAMARAAGMATRKAIRRRPGAGGKIRATARAAGSAIQRATLRPRGADG